MVRAIGSSTPSRAARPKPASPPILRLHNPSILTRARSARPEHVTSHSHGKGAGWPPSPWLPLAPFYSGTLVPFYSGVDNVGLREDPDLADKAVFRVKEYPG